MLKVTNLVGFMAGSSGGLTYVGTLGQNATSAVGTTVAITLGAGVAIGEFIVIGYGGKTTGAYSCADSRGNTYTVEGNGDDGVSRATGFFWTIVTTALQTSDTITLTAPASAGRALQGWQCTGRALLTRHSNTNFVGSTPISIVTSNTVGVGFGVVATNNASTTFTPGAQWTEDYDVNGITISFNACHDASTVGTLTMDPTASTSSAWHGSCASFN